MLEDKAEDRNETQDEPGKRTLEQEKAERVARVIESVRKGTYQVRNDVLADRLIDTMLRRPKKR